MTGERDRRTRGAAGKRYNGAGLRRDAGALFFLAVRMYRKDLTPRSGEDTRGSGEEHGRAGKSAKKP